MAPGSIDLFYSRLPVNEIPLCDLLAEEHLFFKVPANWHVLITDVKKSTAAVTGGLHETVNLVATGSIVAVLNIAYKSDITVPFFFGGDGATFIIPPSILDTVTKALLQHQENTKQSFGIHLRVGHVPVDFIYAHGHELAISKLKTSDFFAIPVILGDGLSYAEKIIKGEDYMLHVPVKSGDELDMSGMQCRWDKIKPPENYDEVVSLLVVAQPGVKQSEVFSKVISNLDQIYGGPQKRSPITVAKLRVKGTLQKLAKEMRVRFGSFSPFYLLGNRLKMAFAPLYFRTKTGRTYLHQLVALSDTLVMDGKISTVISGTQQQREQLQEMLNRMEAAGEIWYGLYVSNESVMSCYVRNLHEKHIHFVDGSEGGYTMAAVMLKKKLLVQAP